MKRFGHLMEAIADPENLRVAFWKASKGKRGKADCRRFGDDLDRNISGLRAELLSGEVRVGDHHFFRIHDPKERLICAASFRERVLQHALMNVCEPIFERATIFDSYACRKGKGQLAAVTRALDYTRRHDWFLKMDVRKYFDSIDHEVLRRLLAGRFKDARVLAVFDRIIDSYNTEPGRGVPIGNLTSQHFANFYLGPLDRHVKEDLGRRVYVRYMDDFVVWGASAADLVPVWRGIERLLGSELRLEPKGNVALNRTAAGLPFLGYRILPEGLRLARRSKDRFARKFRAYERIGACGQWSDLVLQQRMTALVAFTLPARSRGFRAAVLQRLGMAANGLEPRETRGQLEQQREELPDGEPQQQQPVQQEQQPRVPVCPAPSSTGVPEGAPADPVAIPSRGGVPTRAKRKRAPPGVSSGVESSGRRFRRMWTRAGGNARLTGV